MNNKQRYQTLGGSLLALAGVAGAITLDNSKYGLISLLGVVFLLTAIRNNKHPL